MDKSFIEVYNSKSKFFKRYMSCCLKYSGSSDFVKDIFYRYWDLYNLNPYTIGKDFNYFRKHIESKFDSLEIEIIYTEKRRTAEIQRQSRTKKNVDFMK